MRASRLLAAVRASRPLRGGGGHGHGGPKPTEFGGFVPPPVETSNKAWATVIGATTWFWIMYRFKQDGGVLFGLYKPWDAPH